MREFFVLQRIVGRTWRGVLTPGYFESCNCPSDTTPYCSPMPHSAQYNMRQPVLIDLSFFFLIYHLNCFLFLKIMYEYFGCAESWLLHQLFSSCGEWELLSSCGVGASHCDGFSCLRAQALGAAAGGPSSCGARSSACGIFLDPCLLHWQADSLP